MGRISADRYPQYNGILTSTVTGASSWTTFTSADFYDALFTGLITDDNLRFTSIQIANVGSVAIQAIWSRDAATVSGKSGIDSVMVAPGTTLAVDVYPYSTVDPGNPGIIYGPRCLGVRTDQSLTFTGTGVGTGANLCKVRINAGFLGV